MYELSRVRLFSVGPAGARYQDVTLDLRGVGEQVKVAHQEDLFAADDPSDGAARVPRRPAPASVLFLENGGGKSVLLKLIFSVLLPGRRQVVGTTSTSVLEKFVLAEDVAHVACEWMHTATGRLLVTGKVSEWRGHVASTDPEKLADAWYSLRPHAGFGLDQLPFTVDKRRVTATAFRERLHEADRDDPQCELTWETGQRDWTRHLVDTGLDPELFRYQRTMNAGEGEAAEAFSFPSDEAFVDFLLRAVLDPEEPQNLADLVAGYATKLAQREELETERDFVDGTLERLTPLVEAEALAGSSRAREQAARDAARSLAEAIVARRAAEDERAAGAAAALADTEEAERDAARAEKRLQDTVAELRRLTAALEVDAATRAEADATRDRDDARSTVDAWAAVEPVLRYRVAAGEAARLRTRVDSEQEKARPALHARTDAARVLAAALHATASEADAASGAAGTEQEAADRRAAAARAVEVERSAEAAVAEQAGERARADLAAVDEAVSAAERDGHLEPGADVATAASEARERAQRTARAVDELHAKMERVRRDRRGAEERRSDARSAAEAARSAVDTAASAHDDAVAAREALAAEPRAAELLGVDAVRPDSDAELLVERLTAAIGTAERERTAAAGEQARDQRALQALGSGGLLPEPPEVEAALGVLEAAGVTAWSGWRYLTMLPSGSRDAVLARLPHLVDGVLLNSPDDLPRAREELTAARLLPSCLVAVGTTAAMHEPDTAPGVELVVPPNPAMYDEDAAAQVRETLTAETAARASRMEELAAAVDGDRELRSRFAAWRERRPTVDALADALQERRDALTAAERDAAEAAAAVAALDERADALEADRPERERAAAAARERADALEALRTRVSGRDDLVERQRAAPAAAARAGEAAASARSTAETAAAAAVDAGRTRDRQEATAVRAREELAALPLSETDTLPSDPPESPLSVLREEFRRADSAYATAEVDADLRGRLESAEQALVAARQPIDALGAGVLEAAEALLRNPDGSDSGSRRAAAEQARAALNAADDRLRTASAERAVAQRSLDSFPDRPRPIDGYDRPRDAAHGRELVEQADGDRRAAEDAAVSARRASQAARDTHASATRSAEGFGHVVAGMDDVPDATGAAPFDGDVDAALTTTKQRQSAVRAAAGERHGAERDVREAVDAVAQFAQDARFSSLSGPVRKHISGVARADMPGLAPEWIAALRPRLRSLDDDLAHIERHRSGIVTRLSGMVGEAVRTLRLAERLSELPDGLGDWSGQKFLRVRFETVEDSVLRHELGDVVDRAASSVNGPKASRELRDGMSLLLRGVRAAMPKGVRVEMLKPDAVLRTERLRVSEIRDVFSGGQQLTAAIVLYCTMAALRAHQRGQGRRPHAGVLFLDNPIGRASAGYLLELQFGVARALGVQLVYTTGLFDAGALAAFPLIIRLRNDADLRAGRKYLSVDDRVATVLGEPPDADGTGSVTATRLYRRPEPAAGS